MRKAKHEEAASEASTAWQQVDPFAAVSGNRTGRDESKWSKGGTITTPARTPKGYGIFGEGFIDYTKGSVLGGSIATDMSLGNNKTGQAILVELQKMNANQKQLLTV